MSVQHQPPHPADAVAASGDTEERPSSPHGARPNLAGDLNAVLSDGPAFSPALRGYDRLQVDNYVAWAETELRTAHRMSSQLLNRLAASEVERQRAQQLLELSEHSGAAVHLTDRVAELLRMATEEATAVAAAGAAEAAHAEEIVAAARERADLIVRRARQREAQAVARLQAAEGARSQAQAAVERARTEVADMLAEAAAERDRLALEAAARVAQAEAQLNELYCRKGQVQSLLGGLARELEIALNLLADGKPADFSFDGNRVDARAEDDVNGAPVAQP